MYESYSKYVKNIINEAEEKESGDEAIDQMMATLNYIQSQHEKGDSDATEILNNISAFMKKRGKSFGINSSINRKGEKVSQNIALLNKTFRTLQRAEKDEQ